MKFVEASKQHLELANKVMSEVESAVAEMKDGKTPFNVKAYSEGFAVQHNCKSEFVMHLIQSVVNMSEDYVSKRGRGGGVIPSDCEEAQPKPKKVKAQKPAETPVEPETTDAAPDTERVPNTEPVAEQAPEVSEVPTEVLEEPGVAVVLEEDDEPMYQPSNDDSWLEDLMSEVS